MKNVRLTLQYDGANYSGWQSQRSDITIQSVVETALAKLTGEKLKIVGSGRTDAGVHALMQVASFRTESPHPAATIRRALNALLPSDIRVVAAQEAPDDFNARYSSKGKVYFYLIANMDCVPPFINRFAWGVPYKLNVAEMIRASRHLIGKKDFRVFMGSGSEAKTTIRELTSLAVEHTAGIEFLGASIEGSFIKITVAGDGFLRHMVRNIVGTLVEVGRGRIRAETLADLTDRQAAGPKAPAHGLFLAKVLY